jgi:hypothetical protein
VELIATIVVLSVLGSVASSMLYAATEGYLEAATTAQLHTEASIALARIARELRSVALDSSAADVAPDVESISTSSIVWNDDASLDLSGTSLLLQESGGSAALLLSDVSAFTLAAFDESDASLALPRSGDDCDAIRRIQVSVTLQRYGVSQTLSTKVFLRSTISGAGS